MISRKRVYEIVQVAAPGDIPSRVFDLSVLALIVLNVCAIIAETVELLSQRYALLFRGFQIFSVGVFTLEYALRLWCCTASPDFSRPVRGRLRFGITPMATVDLLAILPFYLPFIGLDLRFIRILRVFRFFRAAKLARYSTALRTVHSVAKGKKHEMLVTASLALILLLLASSLMYYAENAAQPKAFSSIPAAMWWAAATLTSTGHAEAHPVTPFGKLLSLLIAFLGIGMFALPTAILAGGFVEQLHKRARALKLCPHCGRELPFT